VACDSTVRYWRPKHNCTLIVLVLLLGFFGVMLHKSLKWANEELGPRLYQLEERRPT
jgi:hypothetical protein